MEIQKCLTKSLPVILVFLTLTAVFLMPVNVVAAELSDSKEGAIALIDGSLQILAENAEEYQTYVDMADDFLPADSSMLLNELLYIAQLDLSPEEKQASVIEISQTACYAYLQLWLFGEVLGYFTIFDDLASLLSDVGLLGIFLCLLGIG